MAPFEDQHREDCERDAGGAEAREIGHAAHVPGEGFIRGAVRGGPAEDLDRVESAGDGREPAEGYTLPGVAIDEDAQKLPHGVLHHPGGKAEGDIHKRQHHGIAREHATEAGKAVEGHIPQDHKPEPEVDIGGIDPLDSPEEGEEHEICQHVRREHGDNARQHCGEIGLLPPHGQGADHAAGAGVVEIAQHRHRDERPRRDGAVHEGNADLQDHMVELPGIELRARVGLRRVAQGVAHADREQQNQPQRPERPEAPQQAF